MADNQIRNNPGTPIDWEASGGTELLTLTSLATASGRQGALHDFGATVRPLAYSWRLRVQFSTAPVLDEAVLLYWKTSDGTSPDNDDGTGDIVVSAIDKLKNLHYLGRIIVDQAAVNIEMVASSDPNRPLWITHRHGAPVVWNATADTLHATASNLGFVMTPQILEIQ